MSDEVQEVLAEEPAPEQVGTVTPEPEENAPEVVAEVAKTFTQEELDAAIGKRLAREQRKWDREHQQQAPRQSPQVPDIRPEQFNSAEDYAEALAQKKAEVIVNQREQQRQISATLEQYHDKEESIRDKYNDFDQVAYNPNLKITEVMAQTIQLSDDGPDIAYYLGTNPKEADRISRLAPFLQAKEIGKIEAKIADNPPVKKTTRAPAPIPVSNSGGITQPKYDTTDPRSIKQMGTSEWIRAENERLYKQAAAQRNR